MIEYDEIASPTHRIPLVLLNGVASGLGEDRVEAVTPTVPANRLGVTSVRVELPTLRVIGNDPNAVNSIRPWNGEASRSRISFGTT